METLVNLHVHTEYSFLDGMCKINELVSRTKEMGQTAIAVTEHGNMCSVYELYKECKKQNIQPIYGIEFYHKTQDYPDKRFHLIAFAKTMKGLHNLFKLHELSYIQAEKGAFGKMYPIIYYEDLFKYKEDIIITSACIAGYIPHQILHNEYNSVYGMITVLKKVFGDDFYLEVQSNTLPEQKKLNSELIRLSKQFNVKTIVTSDTHYIYKSDAKIHEMLLCMQTKNKMSNPNRFKFSSNDYWLKSEEEIYKYTQGIDKTDLQQCIYNTQEIAEKCKFEYEIPKADEALPRYSDDEKLTLRELVSKGWKEKKHGKGNVEKDRANFELDIIESKGYSGYYLITSDYINAAKNNGVIVGGGRGSGVGSFIAYLSGMTTINPIEHGLLFERFLNPERHTSPDFDVDFSDRDWVVNYLQNKWGEKNISNIIAFGTLTARAIIRKILLIYDFSMEEINILNSSLPKKLNLTLDDCEQSELFIKYKEKYPDIFNAIYRLEGTIDHTSTHAAGVLITPKEVNNFVPVLYDHENNIRISGFDKYMLEELNLYKFDILKLTTLNVVDDTIKLIKQRYNININFNEISRDDIEIYNDLCNGDVGGVFQLEEQPDLTKKLQPKNFSAITALNALIRPGVGDIETYTKRMSGEESFEYHNDIERSYMEETFNTITYQEQFMLRVNKLAGWTLGKGDSLRKVKKIREDKELWNEYLIGCKKTTPELSEKTIEQSWNEIVDALEGGYSFNKSHACSYADLSYQTAWLKHYYPLEFMASLMTSEKTKPEKIRKRIEQCKKLNITLLPPDINKSNEDYTIENDAIRYSINTIKGVGTNVLLEITNLRPIHNLSDLYGRANSRVIDKSVIINLIKAGCFDAENTNRYELIYNYLLIRKDKTADAYKDKQTTNIDIAHFEKEVLGLYLTQSPFANYNSIPFENIIEGGNIFVAGEITKVKEIVDKNKNKMAFLELINETDRIDVIVFASQYLKHSELLVKDNIVAIGGKKDKNKLLLNNIILVR